MASSSVSQEDVEAEFQLLSRRSKIRTARARNPLAFSQRPGKHCFPAGLCGCIDWHLFYFSEQEMKWKQKIEKKARNPQARLKIEGPSTPTNAQRGSSYSLQEALKKCYSTFFTVRSSSGKKPLWVGPRLWRRTDEKGHARTIPPPPHSSSFYCIYETSLYSTLYSWGFINDYKLFCILYKHKFGMYADFMSEILTNYLSSNSKKQPTREK